MSSEAQKEKNKGNDSFRGGNYAEAIGHYSAAIITDRKDHTLPLNRAAAYLKLGKNEDAERDCTTSLSLKPGQVKALFRRAQARIALLKLDEAREDLNQALKIEPKNDAVVVELKKLEELSVASKPPVRKPLDVPSQKQAVASGSSPRRRRVPIEIVEGQQEPTPTPPSFKDSQVNTENLTPISSRSISSSSRVVEKEAPFEMKAPAKLPARAGGGGIFRASGENTVFSTKATTPSTTPSTSVPEPPTDDFPKSTINAPPSRSEGPPISSKTPTPLSLFEFNREWSRSSNAVDRWALLKSVPPTAIPSLFRTSLEAPMLTSILEVFLRVLGPEDVEESNRFDARTLVREYLQNFVRVPRFSTVLMFLTTAERNVAKKVCEAVGGRVEGWNL
ncbi:hypothetical protein SCHPADRAFT_913687 [Schizopora paradoxa]|uniref:RNA polymerase II-associated protein 3 n=1 Tax=Schizopora paradoxa TaxID=27342 RepID=A0A0H2SJJ8_9AGAM|nr:hypothetical protein SCHPADRAFT_913687 [Schizopora paradoxa]